MSLNTREIRQFAVEDALGAIARARTSRDPIQFITGNQYHPPLRGQGRANKVYRDEMPEGWELYVEVFEETLNRNEVYLGVQEDEGSLYVVDLKRWQPAPDPDEPSTSGTEWEPIDEPRNTRDDELAQELSGNRYHYLASQMPLDQITEAVVEEIRSISPGAINALQGVDAKDDNITRFIWVQAVNSANAEELIVRDISGNITTRSEAIRYIANRTARAILAINGFDA